MAKSAFGRTFATLQDKLLDGLESSAGLTGLYDWLAAVGDIKRPALIGLFIYAASVAFVVSDPMETPVDTIVVGVVMLLWTGFLIYYMFLFVVLPMRLSRGNSSCTQRIPSVRRCWSTGLA
jgi:hypothetical protein